MLVGSRTTWRSILWLALRFPLGLAAFVAPIAVAGTGIALIVAPFTSAFVDDYRPIEVDGRHGGAVRRRRPARCCVLTAHLVDALAWIHGALARALLGPSRAEELASLAARTEQAAARADLARELHDSVGHSVTAAVLQASAARRVLGTDPVFVDDALAAIEDQGRVALDELDRVLAVLRDERGETRPAPTLADVDELRRAHARGRHPARDHAQRRLRARPGGRRARGLSRPPGGAHERHAPRLRRDRRRRARRSGSTRSR